MTCDAGTHKMRFAYPWDEFVWWCPLSDLHRPCWPPKKGEKGTSPQQVAATNTASIRVTVPAGAKVWVDDKTTMQNGSERFFESPPLTPGADFSYDIKAQWRDQDGKEVTQTRRVNVSANASIRVDFMTVAAE
jgi:uncharacterized protein (TIGR03000 family)